MTVAAYPGSIDLSGPAARSRLFEAALGLVQRLTDDRPLLIGVEDVHWSDAATRDLVAFLVQNLEAERLLLVLTLRTDGVSRSHPVVAWLAGLLRSGSAERLDLERLEMDDVGDQVTAITGRAPDAGRLNVLWQRSDGNPLFVEELLAAGDSAGAAGSGAPDDRAAIPTSLVDVLLGRVDAMPPDVERVVHAVAVAGTPVEEALLERALGVPADRAAGLAACPDRRRPASGRRSRPRAARVTRCSGRRSRPRCWPASAATCTRRWRGRSRRRPQRVARRGRRSPPLGRDTGWRPTGRRRRFAAALDAAAAASAVYAHTEASRHLLDALDLDRRQRDPLSPADRVALLMRAADALDIAGDDESAVRVSREALGLIDEATDPTTAGRDPRQARLLQLAAGRRRRGARGAPACRRARPGGAPEPGARPGAGHARRRADGDGPLRGVERRLARSGADRRDRRRHRTGGPRPQCPRLGPGRLGRPRRRSRGAARVAAPGGARRHARHARRRASQPRAQPAACRPPRRGGRRGARRPGSCPPAGPRAPLRAVSRGRCRGRDVPVGSLGRGRGARGRHARGRVGVTIRALPRHRPGAAPGGQGRGRGRGGRPGGRGEAGGRRPGCGPRRIRGARERRGGARLGASGGCASRPPRPACGRSRDRTTPGPRSRCSRWPRRRPRSSRRMPARGASPTGGASWPTTPRCSAGAAVDLAGVSPTPQRPGPRLARRGRGRPRGRRGRRRCLVDGRDRRGCGRAGRSPPPARALRYAEALLVSRVVTRAGRGGDPVGPRGRRPSRGCPAARARGRACPARTRRDRPSPSATRRRRRPRPVSPVPRRPCPSASSRCCAWSRRAAATGRSPRRCSSRARRRRRT